MKTLSFISKIMFWFVVAFALILIGISIANAQVRQGTVRVGSTDYGVYTSRDSYGRTLYDFRGSGNTLIVPQLNIEFPDPVDHPKGYWDQHFVDSLAVTERAYAYWALNSDKYKSINDPEYRKLIIGYCKEQGLIKKDYGGN